MTSNRSHFFLTKNFNQVTFKKMCKKLRQYGANLLPRKINPSQRGNFIDSILITTR